MTDEEARRMRARYVSAQRETQTRILLVEDYAVTAQEYREALEARHYEVESAAAVSEALHREADFQPDVVLLDLSLPSVPGATDESPERGLRALEELVHRDPFRPVIVVTAHSRDRELMREVLQRNHGGAFLFKDDPDIEMALVQAVAVALASPAYQASRTVQAFAALIRKSAPEGELRAFLNRHWRIILGPEYRECHTEYAIARGVKADLLMIRHDGTPDIWELKRPDHPLFVPYNNRLHHSIECARAVGQVMEYIDYAERETQGPLSYEARKGLSLSLHRPRGYVVIGRYSSHAQRDRLRLENSFLARLSILTYDDLEERGRQLLYFLRDHRSGAGAKEQNTF